MRMCYTNVEFGSGQLPQRKQRFYECVCVRNQDSVRERMCASPSSTVVKGGECEGMMWPSVMRAETSAKGSLPRRTGVLAERWGNRWRRKGVRRRDVCACVWTHLVSWPGALAGPGGQECAVVLDGILPWAPQHAHHHPTPGGYLYCTVGK